MIQTNKQKKTNKKIGYVDSKIPDTSQFIATHEFNRLTKINLSIYRTNKKLKQWIQTIKEQPVKYIIPMLYLPFLVTIFLLIIVKIYNFYY